MKTIKIRQFGDTVFFLNSDGFQKGSIKRTLVISEKNNLLEIKYYVITPKDHDEYMGSEKKESDLFDTYEDMIQFYNSQTQH